MSSAEKLGYYPGCTLKTKARNLEISALAALDALGVDYQELERWNCCGAVYSLADDDLIHHVGPVRNLVRAAQQDCNTVITLCSQCYNTLARANLLMREDVEKAKTINTFMDEEPDYGGEVEVLHFLTFLRDKVGWKKLSEKVQHPLKGLKVAPFYGCTLLRPQEVALGEGPPEILQEFLRALGAEPVEYAGSSECCGSYQVLVNPEAEQIRASAVLESAQQAGAEAIVLSCPLCEYNLGTRQKALLQQAEGLHGIPTFYFTQLLALALGLDPQLCHLELNATDSEKLLIAKELISTAPA